MYVRIFEICVLKYANLTPLVFLLHHVKHSKVKLDLLTNISMLLMVEKGMVLEEEYVTLFTDMQKLITNT